MRRQLLVESTRIDGKTQSRERINEETVKEYAEAMQAPPGSRPSPAWPPVTVFFDGTEYWMADGFHRLLAMKQIGRKNIVADVEKGTREDAAWAACAANKTHGLRRTNADKRKTVTMALKLHPEKSNRAIAEHCGVSDMFVGSVRRQVQTACTSGGPVARLGRDGRSYPVPGRGEQTAPENGESDEVFACEQVQTVCTWENEGEGVQACESPHPEKGREIPPPPRPEERRQAVVREGKPGQVPVSPPPAPEVKPDKPVDGVGRQIPEHLVELWNRGQEVQEMLTALSRTRVAIRKAQDTKDPLFSSVPCSAILAHLDQAYGCVQMAKPYAVCGFCQGQGCRACRQTGLLSKFYWETTVPKEHKEAVARLVEKERAACE